MIGKAINLVTLFKDTVPRLSQFLQAFTDFPANVIQTDTFSCEGAGCFANLDQQ